MFLKMSSLIITGYYLEYSSAELVSGWWQFCLQIASLIRRAERKTPSHDCQKSKSVDCRTNFITQRCIKVALTADFRSQEAENQDRKLGFMSLTSMLFFWSPSSVVTVTTRPSSRRSLCPTRHPHRSRIPSRSFPSQAWMTARTDTKAEGSLWPLTSRPARPMASVRKTDTLSESPSKSNIVYVCTGKRNQEKQKAEVCW